MKPSEPHFSIAEIQNNPQSLPNRFLRTDLACEAPNAEDCAKNASGSSYYEYKRGTLSVARLQIEDSRGAERFGREIGTYVTVSCGNPLFLSSDERAFLVESVTSELRRITEHLVEKPLDTSLRVLVAGLGNAHMTADALGPETARILPATRHLESIDESLPPHEFQGIASIAVIAPGVLAQTGIETVELIRGAVKAVSPDLLIAVDALAARSCERLTATVQLSDTGLRPGSGIGNCREALTRETVGCPVVAVGVPTVVDSSSLVYDVLSRAGVVSDEIAPELLRILENGKSFFVSPKEIDCLVQTFAELIADAIEAAFSQRNTTNG